MLQRGRVSVNSAWSRLVGSNPGDWNGTRYCSNLLRGSRFLLRRREQQEARVLQLGRVPAKQHLVAAHGQQPRQRQRRLSSAFDHRMCSA